MGAPPLDFTVIRVGTDTSGRTIWMTRYAWAVWQAVLAHPLVKPFASKVTIVQGAFMVRDGGGAATSAGYHDQGGCWDVRTWNLTTAELTTLIYVCRFYAAIAAWRRDKTSQHGGMDPHCHVTAGWDKPLSHGAANSWSGYLHNTDGLAYGRPDYERRPSPLVTTPKPELFPEEDYMATSDAEKKLDALQGQVTDLTKLVEELATDEQRRAIADRARQSKRYQSLVAKIGGLADQLPQDLRHLVTDILASEPDVTGADAPAPKE